MSCQHFMTSVSRTISFAFSPFRVLMRMLRVLSCSCRRIRMRRAHSLFEIRRRSFFWSSWLRSLGIVIPWLAFPLGGSPFRRLLLGALLVSSSLSEKSSPVAFDVDGTPTEEVTLVVCVWVGLTCSRLCPIVPLTPARMLATSTFGPKAAKSDAEMCAGRPKLLCCAAAICTLAAAAAVILSFPSGEVPRSVGRDWAPAKRLSTSDSRLLSIFMSTCLCGPV
mmetsp:Transcript_46061/g.116541  ORF Transcript_46061/g.116541 Transcript_46061/m.116541 type:complete len:222 (-) Transcript_46061:246-911(-)